jgi:opacity protein-like surface antigen
MRSFLCAAVLVALSIRAVAQSAPKAEIFGGFSYVNYEVLSTNLPSGNETLPVLGSGVVTVLEPTVSFNPRMNLFGWNGSVTANLLPWFGFTTDFGGNYSNATQSANSTLTIAAGPPCVSNCNINTETYQLVVSDPTIYTFLFGPQFAVPARKVKLFAHFLAGGTNRNVTTVEMITTNGSLTPGIAGVPARSDNLFAMAFGGGADYPIHKHLSWRVGADYLTNMGTGQNHIRVATGPVWRVGK